MLIEINEKVRSLGEPGASHHDSPCHGVSCPPCGKRDGQKINDHGHASVAMPPSTTETASPGSAGGFNKNNNKRNGSTAGTTRRGTGRKDGHRQTGHYHGLTSSDEGSEETTATAKEATDRVGSQEAASPPYAPGSGQSRREALAEMFGVGLDESHALTLYDGLKLEIRRGDVVYVTGASGCGKSVLMRALERGLRERFEKSGGCEAGECGGECEGDDPQGPLASLEDVDVGGDAAVVDRFPGTLEEALRVVSIAGLNDAFLLLRPPRELSEGQRYRFRLAMVLAWGARTVLIDEFCSLLDRQTARAVAYRVRRYAERTGTTFIVATSHDDLVEDLRPSLLIRKRSAAAVEVRRP